MGRRFDGCRLSGIHRLRASCPLRLPKGATLGIPRLSVGSHVVGIGTDRLALATGARRATCCALLLLTLGARRTRLAGRTGLTRRTLLVRDRLTIGPQPLLAVEAATTATGTTGTTGTTTATETGATTTAAAAAGTTETTAATTAGTTRTTKTTGTTGTARATGATRATRTTTFVAITPWTAATFATTATAKIARSRGELPADTGTRRLTTRWTTIIIFRRFLRTAELEATEATRLRRATLAAESATTAASATAATAAITTAAATTTLPTAATTATIIALGAAATLSGDPIDDVMELAARHSAVRTLLALKHANQANLVDRSTDDVERFEEARGAIRLEPECFGNGTDRRIRRGFYRRSSLALGCSLALGRNLALHRGRALGRYLFDRPGRRLDR